MTRVLHTGDTHLGYRQYHLEARRQDFLDAFRRVAEDAVEADVDAVVHAGDLFHDRRPDLSDVLGALSVLRTLDDAGIPFLAVVGNHEAKREAQWLDLFESLGLATRLGAEPVVVGDVAFYGLDFVPRSQRDALEYDFVPHDAERAALVAHGLFEPLVSDYGSVAWDAREVLEAAGVAFEAMLLGDEHAPERAEIDGTWVAYAGSTERASAAERDERGYNLVTFDEAGAHVTRRGIETRTFVFVDVDLADGEGADRVRERVDQHDLRDAVVVVSIEGDGEPVEPAGIERFVREQGALAARVTDRREGPGEAGTADVSFADPDDAVRERVRELGLSPAARDIDETVRASKVADTNVADAVESHVRDLLDDGDPAVFEAAEDAADDERPGADEETERPTAEPPGETDAAADGGAAAGGAGDGDGAGAADGPPAEGEPDDADEASVEDDPAGTGADADEGADGSDADDGQASMGDFA
jgi:DNA repair exonuclease SbcCD nuclease subunit